jgi:hydroxyacylglutathione hydrolase
MTAAQLTIRTFTSPLFGQNAYIVRCAASGQQVAIDPGGEAAAMATAVQESGDPLFAIVLTHAHLDHIEGVAELAGRVPAPVHLHPADLPLYSSAPQQAAMFGHRIQAPPPPDAELYGGQVLEFGECAFQVRHVPGHSPGHVLLYNAEAALAFVGDVVFAGSIGRTDLPGGSFGQLIQSIREQVLTLPDETRLLSGHGPETTVGRERATNPFLAANHPGRNA